ncbi:Serine/threonine-protein kinase [Caprine alphaherpesvirus 1]|uniref:Serine/threonine-protein kinase n=1 Tax=Caprine alphaherpesvirus 1 TaxID=39944 RepID=A0AAE6D0D3_9ALPH|nr:Serine/threonine-protein kinase [Caprine alphaherpesvirus 1]QBM10906.1 Serine/threonine-protein kinase [Caprine alphaherpesvirus 1]
MKRTSQQRARGAWRARLACCAAAPGDEPPRPAQSQGQHEPATPRVECDDLYSDISSGDLEASDSEAAESASDSDAESASGLSRAEAAHAARALQFQIVETLTPGSEGRVFVATSPARGDEHVVLKIGATASTLAEAMLLRTMDHANVLRLKAVLFYEELVCMVLPRYRHDLYTYLSATDRAMDPAAALAVVRRVLRGLEYLHSRKIAHRDVKTENIFINSVDDVCLGDLGAARGPITEPRYYGSAGTLETNSPELLARAQYDCRTDVWSVGVVMYELVAYPRALFNAPEGGRECQTYTRQLIRVIRRLGVHAAEFPPGPDSRLSRNFRQYASSRRPPHSQYRCLQALRLPADSAHLLHKMLTFDFRRRPTAAELLGSPVFAHAL